MNGIIGMAGVLLETPLNAEQREYTEIIQRSADSLLALINDILDFSKTCDSALTLNRQEFDLRHLLEEVKEGQSHFAAGKRLFLESRIDAAVPGVIFEDPFRLKKVLNILVGNAVKFTSRGGVTLQVSREETETGAALRFVVVDTGIGIPREKINLLFEPFCQIDASLSRHFNGSGLGLALARGLVNQMQGDIGVESEAGRGSRFWFTLPLSNKAVATEEDYKENLLMKKESMMEQIPDYEPQFLQEQLGDDEETIQEIINLFLEAAPEQIEAISAALKTGDAAMVQRSAHSLKGASSNVGAIKLSQTALKMETMGREQNLHQGPLLMEEIQNDFLKFQTVVAT
jgi:HPt (histidine-containing phosphotransfer) domain-containing protein